MTTEVSLSDHIQWILFVCKGLFINDLMLFRVGQDPPTPPNVIKIPFFGSIVLMYLATQTSTNTVKTFHSERKSAGVETKC